MDTRFVLDVQLPDRDDLAPVVRGFAGCLASVTGVPLTEVLPEAAELYALVRAARPSVVVETGVASGISSAHILRALAAARPVPDGEDSRRRRPG